MKRFVSQSMGGPAGGEICRHTLILQRRMVRDAAALAGHASRDAGGVRKKPIFSGPSRVSDRLKPVAFGI